MVTGGVDASCLARFDDRLFDQETYRAEMRMHGGKKMKIASVSSRTPKTTGAFLSFGSVRPSTRLVCRIAYVVQDL